MNGKNERKIIDEGKSDVCRREETDVCLHNYRTKMDGRMEQERQMAK